MTWKKALGCILGLAAIISINIHPGEDFFADITMQGDGMILLNACCTAVGGLITRVVSRKMNVTRATGYSMQIGGGLLLAAGLLAGPQRAWTITGKGVFYSSVPDRDLRRVLRHLQRPARGVSHQ